MHQNLVTRGTLIALRTVLAQDLDHFILRQNYPTVPIVPTVPTVIRSHFPRRRGPTSSVSIVSRAAVGLHA